MATETDTLVKAAANARQKLITEVSGLSAQQGAHKPSPDAWSIAEVVEHLVLAELGGVAKIWAALDAVRAGTRWSGDLPHRGKRIEEIVAATWRPKEVAPPVATPHIGGPLAAWLAAFQGLQLLLEDLAAQLGETSLEDIVFPHFLSGPLDARQRLEFLRYHMERHLEQIRRIRADPTFPSSSH